MGLKNIKIVVLLTIPIAIILVAFYLIVSGEREKETPANRVLLAHDKGMIAHFQTSFKKQGQRAKLKIGVDIEPIPTKTTEVYINQMKAVLTTSKAPEFFSWWSTYRVRELVSKGLVADITDLWNNHIDEYPPGLREAFTIDNRVYGFPYIVEYWAVWYNKSVFRRLNIQEPDTWAAFLEACETLKSNKITPILSSLQDQWPAFVWFEEMIIGEDPDLYVDLCEGRIKYTHPRVKKAFAIWGEMIKRGFFSDPAERMFSNAGHLWKAEKVGMVLSGSWYYSTVLVSQGVAENNIGVFILPSHNPAAGNNIVVEALPIFLAKKAKNMDAAIKVADWWLGADGSGFFAKQALSFSGNSKADDNYLPSIKKKLVNRIKKEKYRILNRFWEATPTPICDFAVGKFAEFILNPEQMDIILSEIDQFADAYWKNNRHTGDKP